ncbi:GIY-YIG nuclease family protein [Streptomyces griseofuscus]|uniref:GIY-YIG nuclease family protein n=1 Tax=Streptomyces griseofuscus TaxID=146922 RepID=UPI0037A9CD09
MSVRDDQPSRPQGQADETSCVYVIGSPGSSLVKVGTTTQLAKRLRVLQLSSPVPLEVVWSMPGDRASEAALHEHFAHLREHGEWFDFGDDDPVRAVQAAAEAGLPAQRRTAQPRKPVVPQSIQEESLCECGHELSFHRGRPRACTIVGWDEWLDCQCRRFALAVPGSGAAGVAR